MGSVEDSVYSPVVLRLYDYALKTLSITMTVTAKTIMARSRPCLTSVRWLVDEFHLTIKRESSSLRILKMKKNVLGELQIQAL